MQYVSVAICGASASLVCLRTSAHVHSRVKERARAHVSYYVLQSLLLFVQVCRLKDKLLSNHTFTHTYKLSCMQLPPEDEFCQVILNIHTRTHARTHAHTLSCMQLPPEDDFLARQRQLIQEQERLRREQERLIEERLRQEQGGAGRLEMGSMGRKGGLGGGGDWDRPAYERGQEQVRARAEAGMSVRLCIGVCLEPRPQPAEVHAEYVLVRARIHLRFLVYLIVCVRMCDCVGVRVLVCAARACVPAVGVRCM